MLPYTFTPIGAVHSPLQRPEEAPAQGAEGAPEAWLEIYSPFREGLEGLEAGQWVDVLTWLHLAERDILKVHPRGDPSRPLKGVFATRSPHRPNPIGLHRVEVREIRPDGWVRVGALEAVEGTPILDIKPALQ